MLMESDDDMLYEDESGNEIDDEDEFVDMGLEPEPSTTAEKQDGEEFQYDILTADEIVQHMVDCIREVNSVIQVYYSLAFTNCFSHMQVVEYHTLGSTL